MPALPSDLRRVLENAVVAARDEATGAAAAALKRLAVGVKEFPNYLAADERVRRQKLRAAARQLGDPWNADKQAFTTLNKLTHEVAYEHWHRMLFARFLAENNLLIHLEHGVHVDLSTVAELAQEEATKSGTKADTWAMAGRFAAAMLPQIFRPDDPALAVQLAPEHQQALEKILESLPPSVFTADDSLGWVYQFWQSAEKDRVNAGVKGGDKITGETLPAVTQLFTEHYMVLFLLHNTIGAWHAGKLLATPAGQKMAAECTTEAELREFVALPGHSFGYLRFVSDDTSLAKWRPAAGAFPDWPKAARDLKVLDPCCGSGHFLVAALELLARLRMAEEHLNAKDAALAVIQDNLFGLELDARCTQIAAFNVAQAAWKLAGEHFAIPELHIACAGLAPSTTEEQWLKLADSAPLHSKGPIKVGLHALYKYFKDAPTLGSLIEAGGISAVGAADYETLRPFLAAALGAEKDADAHERAVTAQGIAKAAEILAGPDGDGRGYTLVITNVPYLGRGGQDEILKSFAEHEYPDSKADLATVFVSRILRWLGAGGTAAVVTPQSWHFFTTYRKLRERLLKERTWNMVARLGPGAFETIGGHVVNVALTTLGSNRPTKEARLAGVDVTAARAPSEKAAVLRGEVVGASASDAEQLAIESAQNAEPLDDDSGASANGAVQLVLQADQLRNPDARIRFSQSTTVALLSERADSFKGMSTGDLSRFIQTFWERWSINDGWVPYQGGSEVTQAFGGRERILLWEEGRGVMVGLPSCFVKGTKAWGKAGITINQTTLRPTLYLGELFDENAAAVVPFDGGDVAAIWLAVQSDEYQAHVSAIDTALKTTNKTLVKVPFDLARWQKVAAEKYPHGLPEPQSDDPTQWLFHGHPAGRVPLTTDPNPHLATVLQVAVARVVGYKWPAELDDKMRLAPEARAWAERVKELESHADDDGVVPLVNINKERPGHERVRALLEAAFGSKWTPGLLNDLLAAAGAPGESLDDWLRGGDFWAQHCSVFDQRPFVWQIWDGKKDGFNILVHYHRLAADDGQGHKLLTKITYTYLGDWIAQQQAAAKRGEAGADLRLKAAQDLQKKLEAILAGEPPYDIFVRWKPLHEQPIGWNPDINDGVRVNVRPFVIAGVLRGKVNVKWTKDRGKEPESIRPKVQFPWFWSCPEDDPPTDFMGGDKFTGERLNDLHYTGQAKESARRSIGGAA
ncbi:MAG: SAM-dependent DNA methyltransferase [Phycisphaerales bacterium]|nr:SAM-dependent DNA methyltransferase [Phycisphaerales bacterium]